MFCLCPFVKSCFEICLQAACFKWCITMRALIDGEPRIKVLLSCLHLSTLLHSLSKLIYNGNTAILLEFTLWPIQAVTLAGNVPHRLIYISLSRSLILAKSKSPVLYRLAC